jgi:hypothetical protein
MDKGKIMKKYLFIYLACFLGTANAATIENFTSDYNVSNWSQSLNGGSIDTSGAPTSIVEISSNTGSGFPANTDFTVTSLDNGIVTFNWVYNTEDEDGSFFDPFGWLLNGTFTQLTTDNLFTTQSGAESFSVNTGDTFGFRMNSFDSALGSATTVISNFSAPGAPDNVSPVPVPAAVWLFGTGLIGLFGMRKKSSTLSA